jgi:hypothetical protein
LPGNQQQQVPWKNPDNEALIKALVEDNFQTVDFGGPNTVLGSTVHRINAVEDAKAYLQDFLLNSNGQTPKAYLLAGKGSENNLRFKKYFDKPTPGWQIDNFLKNLVTLLEAAQKLKALDDRYDAPPTTHADAFAKNLGHETHEYLNEAARAPALMAGVMGVMAIPMGAAAVVSSLTTATGDQRKAAENEQIAARKALVDAVGSLTNTISSQKLNTLITATHEVAKPAALQPRLSAAPPPPARTTSAKVTSNSNLSPEQKAQLTVILVSFANSIVAFKSLEGIEAANLRKSATIARNIANNILEANSSTIKVEKAISGLKTQADEIARKLQELKDEQQNKSTLGSKRKDKLQ